MSQITNTITTTYNDYTRQIFNFAASTNDISDFTASISVIFFSDLTGTLQTPPDLEIIYTEGVYFNL